MSSTPSGAGVASGLASHGSSPDALSASSRSSSYSSVVSNGSNDTGRNKSKFPGTTSEASSQQTTQQTPTTATSSSKKPAAMAGFLPEDIKHPGAIGTRTVSPKPAVTALTAAAATNLQKNPWSAVAGSPVTPEGISGYVIAIGNNIMLVEIKLSPSKWCDLCYSKVLAITNDS